MQLMEICAYLAPEPIPLALFTRHPGLLPEPLAAAAADPLAFAETIAVPVDYSLAKRTPVGIQLHRLVQAALRAHSDQAHSLEVALALLQADAPGPDAHALEEWRRWPVLFPHILATSEHVLAAGRPPAEQSLTVLREAIHENLLSIAEELMRQVAAQQDQGWRDAVRRIIRLANAAGSFAQGPDNRLTAILTDIADGTLEDRDPPAARPGDEA